MSKEDSSSASLSDVATVILENGHLNIESNDDNLLGVDSLCRLGLVSEEAIKAHCEARGGGKTLTYASDAPRVPEQRALASKLGFSRVSKMKQAELHSLLEPYMSILQYFPVEMARRVKDVMVRKEAHKQLENLVHERQSQPRENVSRWLRTHNFLDILAADPEKCISLYQCQRVFHLSPQEMRDIPRLPSQFPDSSFRRARQSMDYPLWSVVERAMILRGGIEGIYRAQDKLDSLNDRMRNRNKVNLDLRFNLLQKVLAKNGVCDLPSIRQGVYYEGSRACREYLLKRSRPTKQEVLETARMFQEDVFFRKHTLLNRVNVDRYIYDKDEALRLWVEENRNNLEEAMRASSLPSSLKNRVMAMHSR